MRKLMKMSTSVLYGMFVAIGFVGLITFISETLETPLMWGGANNGYSNGLFSFLAKLVEPFATTLVVLFVLLMIVIVLFKWISGRRERFQLQHELPRATYVPAQVPIAPREEIKEEKGETKEEEKEEIKGELKEELKEEEPGKLACLSCGKEVKSHWEICPNCKEPLTKPLKEEPMEEEEEFECEDCGTVVSIYDIKCPGCGLEFEEEIEEEVEEEERIVEEEVPKEELEEELEVEEEEGVEEEVEEPKKEIEEEPEEAAAEEEEKEETAEEEVKTYSKSKLQRMRKAELIELAKKIGVGYSGTKADIIDRIIKAQHEKSAR